MKGEPHFHPEKNIVNGTDVCKGGNLQGHQGKVPVVQNPVRTRSDSVCSENEAPLVGSPPIVPHLGSAFASQMSPPSTGGVLSRAFQLDTTPKEKRLFHEFDIKWQ